MSEAVEAFLNGADVFEVQALLRHEDIAMTLHYMRLAEEEKNAIRCAKDSLSDKLLGWHDESGNRAIEVSSDAADQSHKRPMPA